MTAGFKGRSSSEEAKAAFDARVDFMRGAWHVDRTTIGERCESEIEKILAYWLLTIMADFDDRSCDFPMFLDGFSPGPASSGDFCVIVPQFRFKTYRLDFAIFYRCSSWDRPAMIAIECDGHDYHDGTKEAAERDKKRNRALTTAGWHVLRFTGREIHRNPRACAEEVEGLLTALYAGDIAR